MSVTGKGDEFVTQDMFVCLLKIREDARAEEIFGFGRFRLKPLIMDRLFTGPGLGSPKVITVIGPLPLTSITPPTAAPNSEERA